MKTNGSVRSIECKPHVRKLRVDQLVVYPAVQRTPPTKAKVKQLADAWDWSKVDMPSISERRDGTFSILDGQRRVLALKMLGQDEHRLDCVVYTGLTEAQEAEMFLGLNDVRQVSIFDRFFTGVTARRPECVGITATCEKHGWTVRRGASHGAICCVDAMMRVWSMDTSGALLSRTLQLLTDAFGRDKNTVSGHLVGGLARFFHKHPETDISAFKEKLQAKFPAPIRIVTLARGRMEQEGGPMAQNVCEVLVRVAHGRKVRS